MALVTHRILTQHLGECSTTPNDAVGVVLAVDGDEVTALVRGAEVKVSLKEQHDCILSNDDWRGVTTDKYGVVEVSLPAWLSPEAWLRAELTWKYAWGSGVDASWPEAWQRGLAHLTTPQRMAAVTLLKTKAFRSPFRASLRDQIVAWLETPSDARTHASPLSRNQWGALIDVRTARAAERRDSALYRNRGVTGAPAPA